MVSRDMQQCHEQQQRLQCAADRDLLDDELSQLRVDLQLDGDAEPRARVEAALRYVDEHVAVLLQLAVRQHAVRQTQRAEELTALGRVGRRRSVVARAGVALPHVEVDLDGVWALGVPPGRRDGHASQTDHAADGERAGARAVLAASVRVQESSDGAERRLNAGRRRRRTAVIVRRRQTGVEQHLHTNYIDPNNQPAL